MEIRMGTIGSGVIVRHILKGVERTEEIACKAVYSSCGGAFGRARRDGILCGAP